MSNQTKPETKPETEQAAATEQIEPTAKADKREMSAERFQEIEHEIQTGVRDTMPDETPVKDVFKNLVAEQKAQAEKLKALVPKKEEEVAAAKVEVTTFPNGMMSATAIGEKVETAESSVSGDGGDGDKEQSTEPANDLSKDFPFRDKLIAAGFVSMAAIARMSIEELKRIDNIGPKSAEAIFNYGKSA